MVSDQELQEALDGLEPEKAAFRKYDKDGTGTMSLQELQDFCYDLGVHLSDDELVTAMQVLDADRSGSISYEEFMKWWKIVNNKHHLKLNTFQKVAVAKAAQMFRKFDRDNSGDLDLHEFEKLHTKMMGIKLTRRELDRWMKVLDSDRDGRISFNEYVSWLLKSGALNIDPARSATGRAPRLQQTSSELNGRSEQVRDAAARIIQHLYRRWLLRHPKRARSNFLVRARTDALRAQVQPDAYQRRNSLEKFVMKWGLETQNENIAKASERLKQASRTEEAAAAREAAGTSWFGVCTFAVTVRACV
eukprot:TRINITY_DN9088_c0_g1_i2.p1 TRINITY_DN9088_c0_g1~~TRINITY_DN9088_c0_g1_i2.p1  ORF type:complete len:304 (-),score=87.92 TRINITY_DN9088_c0_g1_i2:26-937(-)